jgi:alpha-amylase/alpha-mannosidase (GH57 family)
MERYVCIHGHFYQPPRENPWLEVVEIQDSAYPYHDWNERITAECYAPNSASRILDGEDRIIRIVNNYSKISFNFGPTLLSWLAEKSPAVYEAILAADKESQKIFSGHGSAMAQVYNHAIMPLANRRDKETQIAWGLSDFERRFGRHPEGMWLAETAVDTETLELLAQYGLKFTVLAPSQAQAARHLSRGRWRDVADGSIDPSMAYRLTLPSGRTIALFFYDGPISRAVAFEGLLDKGEYLASRLAQAFSDSRDWPQLVHIATDGETYGHHHQHGDMALAYALEHIESSGLAKITNYGEYLERHPPLRDVRIKENTSWSCVHGIERWRSNCGCNSGGHPGWNQNWRAPLREALDWLRDQLASRFEGKAGELLASPWRARDRYVEVILDRSPATVDAFLSAQQVRPLSEGETIVALKLLEMQRHALLMFTSCGWFFDELSGIETVQVIQYAGRALQLSQELFGDGLEEAFLERLGRAKSNLPQHPDGRAIFTEFVKPSMAGLQTVGANYAIRSLFETDGTDTRVYCFTVSREDYRLLSAGKMRLALGRAKVRSEIVREAQHISFGVLHLGDHNVNGGVREFQSEEAYGRLCSEVTETFERGDLREILSVVDRHFGSGSYTLRLLFRDEQRRILRLILNQALEEAEASYRRIFEHYAPMMRFMADLHIPPPRRFQIAAEFTLNSDIRRGLEADSPAFDRIRASVEEATRTGISLDASTLEFAMRGALEKLTYEWANEPADIASLESLHDAVGLANSLPFQVNFWTAQNVFFRLLQEVFPEQSRREAQGDAGAGNWVSLFVSLGEKLRVRVEHAEPAVVAHR